jgi:phospholipid/cholesterol/gamma-HCH transport system ATP-binding protein
MQKRVLLLALLSTGLNICLCDEPNSGLDPNTAILIDNLIKEITEEYDITTVINTHDMNSVMEIERILFLKDGLKAWEGKKKFSEQTINQL